MKGLIGIIAARLKDYFNKPSIVITASNELLKGSARSVYMVIILVAPIKSSLDHNIIINGGVGHNAWQQVLHLKKSNLKNFEDFILKDFSEIRDFSKK